MAWSRLHRWARRTFLSGNSDDMRQGAPAHPYTRAHIGSYKHAARTQLLTLVCVRASQPIAPSIDAAVTTSIAGVLPVEDLAFVVCMHCGIARLDP